MSDCIFCKIVEGKIPCSKIYEDDDFLAFLDIAPVNKGHSLIIPKKHCENLMDFPRELEERFVEVTKKIADGIVKGVGADGFNLSMNNGPAAGQVVFHAHFHIIPRFANDGHVHWDKTSYDDGEEKEFADRIAKQL